MALTDDEKQALEWAQIVPGAIRMLGELADSDDVKAAADDAPDFVHSTQFFSCSTLQESELINVEEHNSRTCTVRGCHRDFPDRQQNGWSISLEDSGPVCLLHWKRYSRYTAQLRKKGETYDDATALTSLWNAKEMEEDDARTCSFQENLQKKSKTYNISDGKDIKKIKKCA